MVGPSLFSQPYFSTQPPLQSPPKIRFSTSDSFYFPIPPLLVHKITLTVPTNSPFLYTSVILHPPYFTVQTSQQSASKIFPYFSH